MLNNGAGWKELPRQSGFKTTVSRFFQRSVREGGFERLSQDAGQRVELRRQCRLYECFLDAAFDPGKASGAAGRELRGRKPPPVQLSSGLRVRAGWVVFRRLIAWRRVLRLPGVQFAFLTAGLGGSRGGLLAPGTRRCHRAGIMPKLLIGVRGASGAL